MNAKGKPGMAASSQPNADAEIIRME